MNNQRLVLTLTAVAAAAALAFLFIQSPLGKQETVPHTVGSDSTNVADIATSAPSDTIPPLELTTTATTTCLVNNQILKGLFTPNNDCSPALYELLEKTVPASSVEQVKKAKDKLKALVEVTQAKQPVGWVRTKQIRWETEQFHNQNRDQLMPLLTTLGVVDEVKPTQKEYDYALVVSCTVQILRKRLAYLADLYRQGVRFKQLVFLGGDRELYPMETHEELLGRNQAVLPNRSGWRQSQEFPTNEIDMIPWVYEQSELSHTLRAIPMTYIAAPKVPGSVRVHTDDIVKAWVNSDPVPGNCLLVTSQPFIIYQQIIFQTLMDSRFTVEAVGYKADASDTTIEIYLDALAYAVRAEQKYRELIWHNQ